MKGSKLCLPDKNHTEQIPDISMQQTRFTKQLGRLQSSNIEAWGTIFPRLSRDVDPLHRKA